MRILLLSFSMLIWFTNSVSAQITDPQPEACIQEEVDLACQELGEDGAAIGEFDKEFYVCYTFVPSIQACIDIFGLPMSATESGTRCVTQSSFECLADPVD